MQSLRTASRLTQVAALVPVSPQKHHNKNISTHKELQSCACVSLIEVDVEGAQ